MRDRRSLVGLAGSASIDAGREAGLRVAAEGFPDRAYMPDGTLMPRNLPGAVIESPEEVAANALKLIRNKKISVDTLCLHGDNIHADQNAKLLREILTKNGVEVAKLV